jgi:hypothetical protein
MRIFQIQAGGSEKLKLVDLAEPLKKYEERLDPKSRQ